MLVVADEVDDFLDRDKLVFNICSNKANAFQRPVLDLYFEVSRAVYRGDPLPEAGEDIQAFVEQTMLKCWLRCQTKVIRCHCG